MVQSQISFATELQLGSIFLIVMSAPIYHRNHAQHISISEDLSEELKTTGQDLLLQINNLNQKLSDQLLIKVINVIVGGIYGIIPDLQEVIIKTNSENENNADLRVMLSKLSQYCNEMVQGYDSDSSTLKIKFQAFIKNILLDAESLLNIIKKDNLHDFKHELVDSLKEIMYTIHLGQIRMQVESYNGQELKILTENSLKQFFENVSVLDKCSLEVLKTLAANVKYNVKHALRIIYYYNKAASNYDDINIQRKILNAADLFNSEIVTAILMKENVTDTKEAVKILKQLNLEAWKSFNELFQFSDISFENNKSSENLRDIAKMAISYYIIITNHAGSYIKRDGLFDLLK